MVDFERLIEDAEQLDKNKRLLHAAESGDITEVSNVIEQGAQIHFRNDEALRLAARRGKLEIVKVLVEKGADIRANNDRAFRVAAVWGHLELVKFFVDQGADNDSALRWAAGKGHLELVKYLIEKGAPIAVAKEHGTDAVKEFCKAYELRKVLDDKLDQSSESKPKPKVFKI